MPSCSAEEVVTGVCQRWTSRRTSYRPKGELFDPRAFKGAPTGDDTAARTFVQEHHYSASYPVARFRFGLYSRLGELVGVAVFSVPARASDWPTGATSGEHDSGPMAARKGGLIGGPDNNAQPLPRRQKRDRVGVVILRSPTQSRRCRSSPPPATSVRWIT